ncbi:MAG: hypothetical protein A3C56_08705 [Ignavibacteria bacterium RIFCSPHIGHO2_02_FULL_56_12]|nr:MAG: hypothetical protein A3C56_08705 [Ignavibacteria bacterium RIFCSPHIGHO2_02_FULL_56_12]
MDQSSHYYSGRLSADRLRRCYDIAPPRVRQYLEAELDFVLQKIRRNDLVLELGCGYGRILPALAANARGVVGVDNSISSLLYGRKSLRRMSHCFLVQMDAVRLSFRDHAFDLVVCIQNGISAFHVNQRELILESIRVARKGAIILYSSYSERFWKHRLDWFRRQADAGLLGEIDEEKTRDGVIVCRDGFTASTVSRDRFLELTAGLHVRTNIVEVDESSLFCEMVCR